MLGLFLAGMGYINPMDWDVGPLTSDGTKAAAAETVEGAGEALQDLADLISSSTSTTTLAVSQSTPSGSVTVVNWKDPKPEVEGSERPRAYLILYPGEGNEPVEGIIKRTSKLVVSIKDAEPADVEGLPEDYYLPRKIVVETYWSPTSASHKWIVVFGETSLPVSQTVIVALQEEIRIPLFDDDGLFKVKFKALE